MFWPVIRRAVLLASLSLAGCAHTDVGPGFLDAVPNLDTRTFSCCAQPEKFYPDGLIRAAFAFAEKNGTGVATKMYGGFQQKGFPGRLAGNRQAEAALLDQLQPLDIVLSGNKSYIWGSIIPGRFTHDLVYLGTEAQLRRAGLWARAELAPLRDDIRAGRLFVEAVTPVTHTIGAARVIEADALAIVRPRLAAAARPGAYESLARSIGAPYDYTFEVTTTDRLSCTEIVRLAMPSLRIRTREAYGHRVIFPDEIAAQAIRGERMQLVGYMVGTTGGFAWRNTHSLMADIAAYWGLPGSDK